MCLTLMKLLAHAVVTITAIIDTQAFVVETYQFKHCAPCLRRALANQRAHYCGLFELVIRDDVPHVWYHYITLHYITLAMPTHNVHAGCLYTC